MIFGLEIQVLVFAILGGVVPTLFWLAFWLWEDDGKREPRGLILLAFLAGATSVAIALPLENWLQRLALTVIPFTIAIATTEEVLKWLLVYLTALKSRYIDEPTDYAIYLITGALGFAAVENTLYLIDPILDKDVALTLLTGNLRFLGATVLHIVGGATLGIALGLAFYQGRLSKVLHFLAGLGIAITLHALFNFFIIESNTSIFLVFGALWIVAIFIVLLFEKLKHLETTHT